MAMGGIEATGNFIFPTILLHFFLLIFSSSALISLFMMCVFRYCWIISSRGQTGLVLEFIVFYVPIWIAIIINFFAYAIVARKIADMTVSE